MAQKTEQKQKKGLSNTALAWILIIVALLLVIVPFAMNSGAEFGGSDDAGSEMVEEIKGSSYEPWIEPAIEKAIGHELPGEIESLLFCVQTGIGVAILAYGFGYLAARNKYRPKNAGTAEKAEPEEKTSPASPSEAEEQKVE